MVLLSLAMLLMIFCLLDQSIFDGGVLKSPTMVVDSSISSYISIVFCLAYVDVVLSDIYTLMVIRSLPQTVSLELSLVQQESRCRIEYKRG